MNRRGILLELAEFIEICVVGRTDKSAIALQQRQVICECRSERVGDGGAAAIEGSPGRREFRR